METKLIFIRHGYSESNENGYFTGQSDAKLTPLGILQAECASRFLEDTHIDKVYSSTLSRAFHTALPIASKRGLEVVKLSGLNEIYGGDWQEKTFSSLSRLYADDYNLWQNNLYEATCTNGESVKDFFKRVLDTVTQIANENLGKCVCIATHATPIRVISCCAHNFEPKDIKNIPWSANASIHIVSYQDGELSFIEENITKHLDGIETNLPSNV